MPYQNPTKIGQLLTNFGAQSFPPKTSRLVGQSFNITTTHGDEWQVTPKKDDNCATILDFKRLNAHAPSVFEIGITLDDDQKATNYTLKNLLAGGKKFSATSAPDLIKLLNREKSRYAHFATRALQQREPVT